MKRMVPVMFALLASVALGGCADADAEITDEPSQPVTPAESEHARHHHHQDYSDVQVEMSLQPTCVAPGGTVTLTVDTAPGTGILYLAYYSDGANGARAPIGAGHGGNGAGYADESGRFQDSWTLSPEAPPGPAKVEVATVSGKKDKNATFAVADPVSGVC